MNDGEGQATDVQWSDEWVRASWASANAAGRTVTTSIILVSGGAVVALFALAGSLLGRQACTEMERSHVAAALGTVSTAVIWFGSSVFLAILTAGLTYFSQFANAGAMETQTRAVVMKRLGMANRLNHIAIGLGLLSLACLVMGAVTVIVMLHHVAGLPTGP